jgi:hypothetical protein
MSRNHCKISKGVSLSPVTTQPSDPENGDIIYNSTSARFEKYEAGAWSTVGSGANQTLSNLTSPTTINQNLNADSFTLATSRQIGDLVPFSRIGSLRYSNPGIVYAMTGDFTLGSNQITNVTGTLPTFQTASYYSVYVQGVTGFNTITTFNSATLLTMSANALANSVGATFYLVAPYLARSEDISVAGQQSGLFAMRSGNVTTGISGTVSMVSGNATGAAGVSGLVNISSGSATTGNSGSSSIRTGLSSSGGNSGAINSITGAVTTGTSGSQSLFTGNASSTAGISGGIAINTGTTTTGTTGQIDIITGSSTSGTTGNLNLGTGNTAGTKGVINAFTTLVMSGNKITNAGDPTAAQDVATKNYVDSISQGVRAFYRNSSAQSLPISTVTTITNWTAYISDASFNATTGIFTSPATGWYEFNVGLTIGDAFGNGDRQVFISDITNSANIAEHIKPYNVSGSGQETQVVSALIYCPSGNQVCIKANQSSTGALTLVGSLTRNYLMIKRVL